MNVIDLGHPITDGMMVFPGDMSPSVRPGATMEADGWRATLISISTHTGTHMDAPAHMLSDGKYLDEFPSEKFFGCAIVADIRKCVGRRIETEDIKVSPEDLECVDFLLLRSDWCAKWNTKSYETGFPTLSPDAAKWLTEQGLKGVGVDMLSVDPVDSAMCEIHKILLGSELVIIENLCQLYKVGKQTFCIAALPISLEKQDGGPARVMAILDGCGGR